MLDRILANINNWFEYETCSDTFTVTDGGIELPFLKNGQYFRVQGSVFNDGLWQYPATGMTDEEFEGEISALAIPRAVLDLAEIIEAWEADNGDNARSPYTNESFGDYSYSKNANESSGSAATWQGVFKSELNAWRKI
jgi:hypothetical protein